MEDSETDSLDAIAAEMQQLTEAMSKLAVRVEAMRSQNKGEQMEIEKEEKVSKATASQYEVLVKNFVDECITKNRRIAGTWVMNFQAVTETNEKDRSGRKKKAKYVAYIVYILAHILTYTQDRHPLDQCRPRRAAPRGAGREELQELLLGQGHRGEAGP